MKAIITAEDMLHDLWQMPTNERIRFFTMVGEHAFQEENLSHQQVFGHLAEDEFTAQAAADYLEVSLSTFHRYVHDHKIIPSGKIGRSQLFATRALKRFKRTFKKPEKTV